MYDLGLSYSTVTILLFFGLLLAIFFVPDFVAVVIIVASVAGLALNWLSRQYNTRQQGWQEERQERWKKGERWW